MSLIENPEVLKAHQQQQQQERVKKALMAQNSRLHSPTGAGKFGANATPLKTTQGEFNFL